MTWLASHPGGNGVNAECRAFDSEAAAVVWAKGQTAAGIRSVVIYEISDSQIERAS